MIQKRSLKRLELFQRIGLYIFLWFVSRLAFSFCFKKLNRLSGETKDLSTWWQQQLMLFLVHLVKMRHSGSSSQCSAIQQQQQQQSFAPELPFLHRLAHTYTVQAIARLLLVLKQHDQLSVSIDSISANHRHVQGFAIEQVFMLMSMYHIGCLYSQ